MASTTATLERAVPQVVARQGQVNPNKRLWQVIRWALLIFGCFYALFPIVIIISAALDPSNTLNGAGLFPKTIALDNFNTVLNDPQHPFLKWIGNSIWVSTASTALTLFMCALAAYALSRFRFQGRQITMLSILVIQVFPNLLSVVAIYLLLQQLGQIFPAFAKLPFVGVGLNTHGGLIMIYVAGGLGFNTWLMKGYFDTVPRDLDESAMVDGATQWQTFYQIILPLIRPILAVIAVLTFIGTYSDFLLARILLTDNDKYTFAVGLSLFIDQQYSKQWGVFAAAVLIGAVPIVIMYLAVQRQISGGLTAGAVKG